MILLLSTSDVDFSGLSIHRKKSNNGEVVVVVQLYFSSGPLLKRKEKTPYEKRIQSKLLRQVKHVAKKEWRGMWELNPRGLSTTDLAGLPHTRLGESRT